MNVPDEELVAEYYGYRQQLDQMQADFREVITHPNYSLPFLQPGRLVKIKYKTLDFGWGVIVNYQKRVPPKVCSCEDRFSLFSLSRCLQNRPVPEDIPPHEQYVLDVLLNCATGSKLPKDRAITTATPGGILPCPAGQKGVPLVVPVLLSTVDALSHLRIYLPTDLRPLPGRETAWKSVLEVHNRLPDGIPLLDPIQNMKIVDDKFGALVKVRQIICLTVPVYSNTCRKSKSWSKECFQALYTKILGFQNYTRSTHANRNASNVSEISRNKSKPHTTFCRWKN